MKQLDLFGFESIYDSIGYDKISTQKMNWPNDFDGAHSIAPVGFGKSDPSYGAVPPKIYESPDKGKTVYERDFGSDPSTRTLVKTSVQQQWNITYKIDGEDL